MSCMLSGRSSAHVERPHYDNEILIKHDDDIHKEHDYDHREHESQYMPARLIDPSV